MLTDADFEPRDEGPGDDLLTRIRHSENIVIGPPGCGKTTWLARQVKRAAEVYTGRGVLVASLTKAAAVEVAGRDTGIPVENIGTLHAHCFRLLERPSMAETVKGIEDWNNRCGVTAWRLSPSMAANPEQASADQMPVFDAGGDELLHGVGVLRHRMVPVAQWPERMQAFHERWEEWKRDGRWMDFTDLIANAMERFDSFRDEPDVVMVDEAQDMSTLEIALVRKFAAATRKLIIVGDPDQALYTWRGADPDAVFGSEAEDIIVLDRSYRVPDVVRRRAVEWIEGMEDRLPIAYQARVDDNGEIVPGELAERPSYMWTDPTPVLEAARGDIADGKTVMILGSCRYMLNPVVSELRSLGEPFHNPFRATAGQWNPMRGSRRLQAFLRPHVDDVMWTWEEVLAWVEPLQARGVLNHGAKSFIESKGVTMNSVQERVDQVPLDGAGLTTLLGLFATDDAREAVMAGDVDWWEENLRHTQRKSQQFSLAVYRRRGLEVLRAEPKLIIGTIHSVKGGEADVVYVFPDLSPAAYWEGWQAGGDGRASILRLMYVAMTRAKEKLVLCGPSDQATVMW